MTETSSEQLEPGLIMIAAGRLKAGMTFEEFFAEGHPRLSSLSQKELAELKERAEAEAKHPRF